MRRRASEAKPTDSQCLGVQPHSSAASGSAKIAFINVESGNCIVRDTRMVKSFTQRLDGNGGDWFQWSPMRTLRLPIWVLETKLQRCRLRPRQPNSRDGFVKLAQALPFLYAAAIAGVVWLCAPEVSEARAWHALRQ